MIVALPTSKLRLACSSCSEMAVFLRLCKLHAVLRDQHIEIGLRDAQHQVLLGDPELRLGLRDLQFGLGICQPVLLAEQRLHQVHAIAVAVVAVIAAAEAEAVSPDTSMV